MTIQVGNAPCSWGVLELDVQGQHLGGEQVLEEMAAAGYRGTELGDYGFLPTDPDELRDALARRELQLVGAFVPAALAREGGDETGLADALRTARLIGAVAPEAFIVLADDNGSVAERVALAGRVRPEHALDDAGWERFARGAERIAKAVRDETGLRTVFHHHGAGYVETAAETDRLLEATDPTLLGLCLDTGHFRFGGGDPREALARHGDRVWHVHFKDFDPAVLERGIAEDWDYYALVREGVFCELGKGAVDFSGFFDDLRGRGYQGWIVVEQDVLPGMGTPLASAQRNRSFLEQLGL